MERRGAPPGPLSTRVNKRSHFLSVILPGHLGQPSRPQLFFSSGERTRFRKVAESSVLARLAKSRCLGRFLGENGEFLTISCKKVTNGAIIQMYVNRLLLYSRRNRGCYSIFYLDEKSRARGAAPLRAPGRRAALRGRLYFYTMTYTHIEFEYCLHNIRSTAADL